MAKSPAEMDADAHEASIENREAYEYWGYLFKSDKTGTPKLKSLLWGLKEVMNCEYENNNNRTHEAHKPERPHSQCHEQPDLTPTQLAHFYRDLHGNYDQLFLATPNESIAFIYKSLGCLHSLQPLHHATQATKMANGDRATAFTDPTVPALKTEGWIMWQTIQILLGPEEHAQFLREAVAKWDVKDVETGDTFPKILPRECFPSEPDKHMVAWYEGVSERLRKEAEEEQAAKMDVRDDSDDDERPRRLRGRRHDEDTDEESLDSRGPALAYFKNPLYRHPVDGRPSIVRRNSKPHNKRPGLSPRQTMMNKGKEAVGSFSRIARNVGSPHLWDGRGHSRSGSANAAGGKAHRQSHSHSEDHPTSSGSDRREHHRRRTGSAQLDVPPQRPMSRGSSSAAADDDWWERSEPGSPPSHPNPSHGAAAGAAGMGGLAAAAAASRHGRSHSQHGPQRDPGHVGQSRRPRSAEPTPSGPPGGGNGEPNDYFAGANDPSKRRQSDAGAARPPGNIGAAGVPPHRKGSTTPPPVPAANGVGVSFGPSAGPLFASHVAKQTAVAARGGMGGGRRRSPQHPPPQEHHRPHHHHHHQQLDEPRRHRDGPQQEPYRRHGDGHRDDRRYDSPRGGRRGEPVQNQRFDREDGRVRSRDRDAGPRRGDGGGRRYVEDEPYDYYDDEPPPRRSREDVGRSRKQTRFAGDEQSERGVSGRRYPDGSPWRRGE